MTHPSDLVELRERYVRYRDDALARAKDAPRSRPEPSDAWARHSREATHYSSEIAKIDAALTALSQLTGE